MQARKDRTKHIETLLNPKFTGEVFAVTCVHPDGTLTKSPPIHESTESGPRNYEECLLYDIDQTLKWRQDNCAKKFPLGAPK